jgi:hypothetical protein
VTNASHGQGQFVVALNGWQNSLDARAFQQEQAAAQIISTAMVLLNATTVAMVAVTIFQSLSSLAAVTAV